jgi:hypothetical protein
MECMTQFCEENTELAESVIVRYVKLMSLMLPKIIPANPTHPAPATTGAFFFPQSRLSRPKRVPIPGTTSRLRCQF